MAELTAVPVRDRGGVLGRGDVILAIPVTLSLLAVVWLKRLPLSLPREGTGEILRLGAASSVPGVNQRRNETAGCCSSEQCRRQGAHLAGRRSGQRKDTQ